MTQSAFNVIESDYDTGNQIKTTIKYFKSLVAVKCRKVFFLMILVLPSSA